MFFISCPGRKIILEALSAQNSIIDMSQYSKAGKGVH